MSEDQEIRHDRACGPGQLARGCGRNSDLDACPGKRILDGDELLPDLCKFVVKVLFGITPEPDNLFCRRDLEDRVLLV